MLNDYYFHRVQMPAFNYYWSDDIFIINTLRIIYKRCLHQFRVNRFRSSDLSRTVNNFIFVIFCQNYRIVAKWLRNALTLPVFNCNRQRALQNNRIAIDYLLCYVYFLYTDKQRRLHYLISLIK